MPFLSEELWHQIRERKKEDMLIVAKWPEYKAPDQKILNQFAFAEQVITQVRAIRNEKNIAPKVKLQLNIVARETSVDRSFDEIIARLCNISSLDYVQEKVSKCSGKSFKCIYVCCEVERIFYSVQRKHRCKSRNRIPQKGIGLHQRISE